MAFEILWITLNQFEIVCNSLAVWTNKMKGAAPALRLCPCHVSCWRVLLLKQIHFNIETNTFCNLDKCILGLRQIHFGSACVMLAGDACSCWNKPTLCNANQQKFLDTLSFSPSILCNDYANIFDAQQYILSSLRIIQKNAGSLQHGLCLPRKNVTKLWTFPIRRGGSPHYKGVWNRTKRQRDRLKAWLIEGRNDKFNNKTQVSVDAGGIMEVRTLSKAL